MIDPTTTGPGPAYTVIMILAIATAAILKHGAIARCRCRPHSGGASRWGPSAAR